MKNRLFQAFPSCLLALACLFCPVPAQSPAAKSSSAQKQIHNPLPAEARIRALLEGQNKAWNEGKLEAFMEGYWRSPELTFFSGGQKLQGWDATMERYRKTYQSGGNEMGKLTFSDLDIQVLGPAGAVVRGRWKLILSTGKELGGLYTLIFRKFGSGPYGGWKIIHDHTSSNQ
jgi:beta-aspartyl-peptidase (threonine type)